MNITFKNDQLETVFRQKGYIVVDALSVEECDEIIHTYHRLTGAENTAFESTMNNPSATYKKEAFQTIVPLTNKISQFYLNNYVPVTANFVIKRPDPNSVVPAHRDWTMCDEEKYTGVNIWVALSDCNALNGALRILQGSHLTATHARGNKIKTDDYNEFMVRGHEMISLHLKKGQAIIYDLRCLHYSPANVSQDTRFAAGCAYIPAEATPIHYMGSDNGNADIYKAPHEFYFNYSYGINEIPADAIKISETKLIESNIDYPAMNTPPNKSIFKDPIHQQTYEKNGYILIDYLNQDEVNILLQEYQKLTSWFKDGFMSSVYAPDVDYRHKIDALLEPFGQKIITQIMNNYRIIISTIMAKGSGEQSAMYPHQDWTLVDEEHYASFNAWIPLVDVDHKNGAMSIMKSGHKLPFSIRGSNIPDALSDKTWFTPEKLTYMPMKAGQALIYDHRCIHVSPINKTTNVRPACVISLVPEQMEAFHYFYDQQSQILKKFKADKEFYFRHVANQFNEPETAEILGEEKVNSFTTFKNEELIPFMNIQEPRKKSIWERLLGK